MVWPNALTELSTTWSRVMLATQHMPLIFWGEALNHAVLVKNMLPHAATGDVVPDFLWSGKKPSARFLRVWGCRAYMHIQDSKRAKHQPKSKAVIHLGYDVTHMSYRLWDCEKRKVVFSRDVTFLEHDKGGVLLGEEENREAEHDLLVGDDSQGSWMHAYWSRLQCGHSPVGMSHLSTAQEICEMQDSEYNTAILPPQISRSLRSPLRHRSLRFPLRHRSQSLRSPLRSLRFPLRHRSQSLRSPLRSLRFPLRQRSQSLRFPLRHRDLSPQLRYRTCSLIPQS